MPEGKGSPCRLCRSSGRLTSRGLGLCAECIRRRPAEALPLTDEAHARARRPFGLPPAPPRSFKGVSCAVCARECRIGEGERGYCGLRTARGEHLIQLAGTPARGMLQWYRDSLPTNCVGDWVCTGSRQRGLHNLAVFYQACSFNCLFCQNWHFRHARPEKERMISATELAAAANPRTYCICFFGGDPAPQMPHALAAASQLAGKGVRVCWETNGASNPRLLDQALELSLKTGGCIKFDLKAKDESLHRALTGVPNQPTFENFARAARRSRERPDPPLVLAATLLVPGYVDVPEVERIAAFIAGIDRDIPYSLLGFAPHFMMADLPTTSLKHAQEAEAAARAAGLNRVRIGNRHLLGSQY